MRDRFAAGATTPAPPQWQVASRCRARPLRLVLSPPPEASRNSECPVSRQTSETKPSPNRHAYGRSRRENGAPYANVTAQELLNRTVRKENVGIIPGAVGANQVSMLERNHPVLRAQQGCREHGAQPGDVAHGRQVNGRNWNGMRQRGVSASRTVARKRTSKSTASRMKGQKQQEQAEENAATSA